MDLRVALVVLASFATFPATDIYLPSLPGMAIYFNVSEEAMRSTLTANLLGGIIASLPFGIASDRIGRKPVFLGGLVLFVCGSFLCCLSSVLPIFMIGRFLQGFGAITVPVVGFVIIHDLYAKEHAARIMTGLGAIVSVAPLIAPSFGGYIDVHLGWRWNFIFLTIISFICTVLIALKLPETRPVISMGKFSFKNTVHDYTAIFKNKSFLIYVSIFAVLCCGEWCYISIAAFYFERTIGLSPDECGIYISFLGFSYFFGTLIASRIIGFFGVDKSILLGIFCSIFGACSLALMHFIFPHHPMIITAALSFYLLGLAIVWGPTATKSLQSFNEQRGTASSIRSLALIVAFALGSMIGTWLSYASLLPLACALFACALCSLLLFRLLDPA